MFLALLSPVIQIPPLLNVNRVLNRCSDTDWEGAGHVWLVTCCLTEEEWRSAESPPLTFSLNLPVWVKPRPLRSAESMLWCLTVNSVMIFCLTGKNIHLLSLVRPKYALTKKPDFSYLYERIRKIKILTLTCWSTEIFREGALFLWWLEVQTLQT